MSTHETFSPPPPSDPGPSISRASEAGCPNRPQQESDLDFQKQRAVRWFSPSELASTAVRLVLSGIFGAYADKREMEAALAKPQDLDYSDGEEYWMDYAADVGDGFRPTYAIARLLGQEKLVLAHGDVHHETRRGHLLILGGDQVYPAAGDDEYDNRLVGPYRAALPCSPPEKHPLLFAIPGNHDWYDGLTSFMRTFCQDRWVGGWKTVQNRSYFAVKLPQRWWLWGIDIQFDTYIDEPQLKFFRGAAAKLQKGDGIVLCTGKPSWAHGSLAGDAKYKSGKAQRNLAHIEQTIIAPTGATVAVCLSGDLHHYARYENADGAQQRITAGGGGAYLYPTHTLPEDVRWPYDEDEGQIYTRRCVFPSIATSKGLRWGSLLLPFKNPSFCIFMGSLHLLAVWVIQFSLQLGQSTFVGPLKDSNFSDLLLALTINPLGILMSAGLVLGLVGFAEAKRTWQRWVVGGLHGLAHLALVLGVLWAAARPLQLSTFWFVVVYLFLVALIGGFLGSLLMGLYLTITHRFFKLHPNETFSAQRIEDYKSFVRMKIDRDGSMTIFPIGLKRVPRRWSLRQEGRLEDPWFEPEREPLAPQLVEPPVSLRPTGQRQAVD